MWRGVVPHVVLWDTCTVTDRKWYPYAHIRRAGHSSWTDRILDKYYPVTDLLLYGQQHTPTNQQIRILMTTTIMWQIWMEYSSTIQIRGKHIPTSTDHRRTSSGHKRERASCRIFSIRDCESTRSWIRYQIDENTEIFATCTSSTRVHRVPECRFDQVPQFTPIQHTCL